MIRPFVLLACILLFSNNVFSQCACCAAAGSGSSGGDFNNGVLTLRKGQFALEGSADFRMMDDHVHPAETTQVVVEHAGHTHVTDVAHEHDEVLLSNMWIASAGGRYGITERLTVSAILPFAFLTTVQGNDHGLGDLVLTGTWSVISRNAWEVAIIGGGELPTGVRKDASFDNNTVVLGSGSFDPIGGLAFSKRWERLTLFGNGLYKHTTTGFDGNYYGSLLVQNTGLAWNLRGQNKCTPDSAVSDPGFTWSLSGGYYGEWLDRVTEEGNIDENSGYYLGYATLGTKVSFGGWSVPLTLSLPVINNMNGNQNDAGYRLRLGVMKTF